MLSHSFSGAGTHTHAHTWRECICIYFAIFDGLFIDDDDSVMEFEMIFNEQN